MAITILEGSNFCISDENGDFTFTTSGLYAFDTRFLSQARADDQRRAPAAALGREGRVLLGGLLPAEPARRRACGRTRSRSRATASSARACRTGSRVQNQTQEAGLVRARARVRQRLRGHLRGQEPRLRARRPGQGAARCRRWPRRVYEERREPVRARSTTAGSRARRSSSRSAGYVEPGKVRFWIELEPRATWELGFDVVPSLDGDEVRPARGAAAVRRGARADRGLAHGLEPARPEAARLVGRPRPRVPALRRRPRVAPAAGRGTGSATFRPQACRGS